MGLIHEKNERPKISCYCTFKQHFCEDGFCLSSSGVSLLEYEETRTNVETAQGTGT
jgi:hypothetical protein